MTLKEEIREILKNAGGSETEWVKKYGLRTSPDVILSAIKDRLPKETTDEYWVEKLDTEPNGWSIGHRKGFNECLLQVSKIIEE